MELDTAVEVEITTPRNLNAFSIGGRDFYFFFRFQKESFFGIVEGKEGCSSHMLSNQKGRTMHRTSVKHQWAMRRMCARKMSEASGGKKLKLHYLGIYQVFNE